MAAAPFLGRDADSEKLVVVGSRGLDAVGVLAINGPIFSTGAQLTGTLCVRR